MNINEARLVSFVTYLIGSWMHDDVLKQLIEHVKACQPEPEVREVVKERVADVVGLLQEMKNGHKIECIKLVRSMCRIGLKEAKDLVEANWIREESINLKARIAELEEENKNLNDKLKYPMAKN